MTEIASILVAPRERPEADLLALGCFEGEAPGAEGLEEGFRGAVERLAGRAGWKGREEQVLYAEARPGGSTVALHGLGPRKDFGFARLSRWFGRVSEGAQANGQQRFAVVLPPHEETRGEPAAERILRAAALAGYRYVRHLSEPERCVRVEEVAVVPPAGEEEAYRRALAAAATLARGVGFARDLANSPANEATPAWMEERTRELGEAFGFEVSVLDAEELGRRGMGGVLAVGAGSAVPPRMVRLSWGDSGPRVALVGKGVTFDSGGISIKPAADMDEMKYDKGGACAVLGAARVVAELGLPVRLQVYTPFVENLLGSRSYRPSDVIRCYNGKTVEVMNTDAEGRLILADAMAWAVEDGAEAMVEMSTLTGGCVVALGHQSAGLFTSDDGIAAELLAAAAASGERLWRLPLYPEYLEEMQGHHADLKNSAGRWGSACTAAAFLSQFTGGLKRWAHLDIAGVANVQPNGNPGPTGATGYGVATAVRWLRRLTEPA
jgi:leucyl aminopeptidase